MERESRVMNIHFLEELAERSAQVVFAFSPESRQFVYLNSYFEFIWKRTRESVFDDPYSLLDAILPHDKEYIEEIFAQFSESPEEVEGKDIEFSVLWPDGRMRWLCLNAYLVERESEEPLVAGFVVDKTRSKENEENIQKFAGRKNSLLEILSHDLSGPLVNIQGLSSLLAKEFKEYNNPKIDRMVEMIASTSERSVGMIREFVKQEFLESVNVQLLKKRVNLVRVIEQTIAQYKASEQALEKIFDFEAPVEEAFAEIDEYKFSQVLNNLISNAIKFTHDGGKITIRLKEKENSVVLTLADNGIGIPARYHQNLFEKFTKAGRRGLKGEPSVGLGMSIIKTIVELHGGQIWFESKENVGSVFYIEVPKE